MKLETTCRQTDGVRYLWSCQRGLVAVDVYRDGVIEAGPALGSKATAKDVASAIGATKEMMEAKS